MDDIAEQQDIAKEISDAISNPVGFGKFSGFLDVCNWLTFISCCEWIETIPTNILTSMCFWLSSVRIGQDIDEDELERELEELEQEELDKDLLGVGPSTQDLPEVPTAEPAKEPASSSKDKKKGTYATIIV